MRLDRLLHHAEVTVIEGDSYRTPDVVEFAVSPRVGQAVLAFARSYSNSGPNSARAGRRAPPAPPAKLWPSKGMAQPIFPARQKLRGDPDTGWRSVEEQAIALLYVTLGPLVVHEMQHLFEIFPGFPLGFLIVGAQQERRVVSYHHRDIAPLKPLTAHLRDTLLTSGDGLGGGST